MRAITLATLDDTHEQIAILDYKAFKTVDALKQYIGTLPAGASLYFRTWARPRGERENKFASAAGDLKKFCDEHQISLRLSTIEPYW